MHLFLPWFHLRCLGLLVVINMLKNSMLGCEYCLNKSELSVVDLEDFCRVFIKAVNRILFTLSNDENEYHIINLK